MHPLGLLKRTLVVAGNRTLTLPEVRKYQQVFTVAMVIVDIGVAQTNPQLFEFDHGHVILGQLVLRVGRRGVLTATLELSPGNNFPVKVYG